MTRIVRSPGAPPRSPTHRDPLGTRSPNRPARLVPDGVRGGSAMRNEEGLRTLLGMPDRDALPGDNGTQPASSPLATRLAGWADDPSGTTLANSALVKAALEAGRTTRKSAAAEGLEQVLGPGRRRRILGLVRSLPMAAAQQLAVDLDRIGGPDAALGRALYLKAALARQLDLVDADTPGQTAALQTLAAFAARLDGMAAAALLERASVLDLDSGESTRSFDVLGWDEKRGVIHARPGDPERADNDGLFQRYMGSCGTTTLQMTLCEADPVRAFVVHDAGLDSPAADDVTGAFQAELLAEYGSAALGRRANYNLSRLRNAIGRMRRPGPPVHGAQTELLDALLAGGVMTTATRRSLSELRSRTGGFPSDAELAELRGDPLRGSDGLELATLAEILNAELSPVTGRRYALVETAEDGPSSAQLDQVEAALRRGDDVPFGISAPGHYMLLSATRTRDGERQFLVSDPWGGTTDWVAEGELVSGGFIVSPFDLAYPGEQGVVDSFYLPSAA